VKKPKGKDDAPPAGVNDGKRVKMLGEDVDGSVME
jgi:hypothetical protein